MDAVRVSWLKAAAARPEPHLGVAPLSDALPAEEVSAGRGSGVPSHLQAKDAAGRSGVGALCALRTENTRKFTLELHNYGSF